MTHILLTNDDGIRAEGLRELWESLQGRYQLTVVAPDTQRSGAGLGITLKRPLQVQEFSWPGETAAWSVTGTPADCVKMALSLILDNPPDLIVSGINDGSNAGRNVLYSGTIGGAIEGVLRGIPGVAVSSVEWEDPDHKISAQYVPRIIEHVLEHPLPPGTLLNVNFPTTLDHEIRGVRMARQGRGYYVEDPQEDTDHNGDQVHWLGGKFFHAEEELDSDVHLLSEGYGTAVPIHVEELTDFHDLERRREHFERLF